MENLTFATESIFHLKAEVAPLLLEHWRELGQKDLTLDPDWTRMALLERAGHFVVFTARDMSRNLRGYAAYITQPHLHYRGATVAFNDVVWLHPDCRRGRDGVLFLRYCEKQLHARRVEKIYCNTKINTNLDALLGRIGYTKTGSNFEKGLK